ncbi:hypothetical protein K7432_007310 [Basidiobolus ranarum]|uniref:Uncharacterized protein n=1 Tax=Basidiobolus ranarum TaxID=34480 RepID=A0ABR2WTK7_9FUNG
MVCLQMRIQGSRKGKGSGSLHSVSSQLPVISDMLKSFLCSLLLSMLLLCQGAVSIPTTEESSSEAIVKRDLYEMQMSELDSELLGLNADKLKVISRIAKRMTPIILHMTVGDILEAGGFMDTKKKLDQFSGIEKSGLEEGDEHVSTLLKRDLSEEVYSPEESSLLDSKLLEIGLEEDKDGILGLGRITRFGFRIVSRLVISTVLNRLIPGYKNITVGDLLGRYYAPEFTPAIVSFLNTKLPKIFEYDITLLGPGFERFKRIYNSIRLKSRWGYLKSILFGTPIWV